jgi:hypothetical protein
LLKNELHSTYENARSLLLVDFSFKARAIISMIFLKATLAQTEALWILYDQLQLGDILAALLLKNPSALAL